MKNLKEDLFQAYFDARKNKRNSLGALQFEMNFEKELFLLHKELTDRYYQISPSVCFVSFYPVKREIFAGSFRDRVVHHLVYNYLNPLCEKMFINDSYSCRPEKGTSYGVKRAAHFVRSCSENYKKDCYILKLDIAGYFMSINRTILFEKLKKIIYRNKRPEKFNQKWLLWLVEKILFNDPTKSCVIKGKKEDWAGMPKNKSLFFAQKNCGLPIGNLTSQLFGNVYLDGLDHFIKQKIGCRYYGRYVDDMLFVHKNKVFLKKTVFKIENYLRKELRLFLHKKKVYLQPFSRGVVFLGKIIKPHRIYLKNKNKGGFYQKMLYWNKLARKKALSGEQKKKIIALRASYFGLLLSCKAFRLKSKTVQKLNQWLQPLR